MPAFLNWFLRLLPTNPICMRLVQGGSRRLRHLYIRAGYLGILIIVLLFMMLGGSTATTFTDLAAQGMKTFQWISYLQLGLICLLTPVFMAGAIAQEANPRTWDILLTTPLNNLQIVLGNTFGRLFFILALLFSSLPLFITIQYFGGVPTRAIFLSYLICSCSALLVAAIAITLCITRTAGRRAVFIFYITVVMYLFVTYAIDLQLRAPVAIGSAAMHTTIFTPLNPFLALDVLLRSNTYMPHDFTGEQVNWVTAMWFGRPINSLAWVCTLLSAGLILFSTLRVRVIGAKLGAVPWYRRLLRLGAKGSNERPARHVSTSPIAWRESVARGATLQAILARWSFAAIGILIPIVFLTFYHTGIWDATTLRAAIVATVVAEIVIIMLTALNMSATAVSREREDGTLDLILTTPIQPGPYISGKLRGLIQFLLPMLLVPVSTIMIVAAYVLSGGLGRADRAMVTETIGTQTITVPLLFPEGALILPIVLIPFTAFCVMVGLQWSIKSKGTIGSVVAAGGLVISIVGVLGFCGYSGREMSVLGAVFNGFTPVNALIVMTTPSWLVGSIGGAAMVELTSARISAVVGSVIAGAAYIGIVYGMHTNMKRTFHMTVRKLAGQK